MTGRTKIFIGGMGLLLTLMLSVCAIVVLKNGDKEYNGLFYRHTKIFSPEIPVNASFAGEAAPLDLYYVREALEREIMSGTFMHSSSILMFKRANRWFPVIEPILKANGIPDDFKYVALAESNLANVVSPAGAEGYWQFIKSAGLKHGLEINDHVDERYHIEKATEAACDYFMEAYRQFNSWTLAAASYNRGLTGMEKALTQQGVSNFYDLYLNDETARYIFRILAIKEVYNHPVRYGFYLRQSDFYPPIPVRQIIVDSSISSLPLFAKHLSINYRILKELNPWVRNYSLPNKSKKKYTFKIPSEGALNYPFLMKMVPTDDTFFHDTLKINEVH